MKYLIIVAIFFLTSCGNKSSLHADNDVEEVYTKITITKIEEEGFTLKVYKNYIVFDGDTNIIETVYPLGMGEYWGKVQIRNGRIVKIIYLDIEETDPVK
jgi:hypothetical protein